MKVYEQETQSQLEDIRSDWEMDLEALRVEVVSLNESRSDVLVELSTNTSRRRVEELSTYLDNISSRLEELLMKIAVLEERLFDEDTSYAHPDIQEELTAEPEQLLTEQPRAYDPWF